MVCMSATAPNVAELATWLNANSYISRFRPVPLRALYKLGNALYDAESDALVRSLPTPAAHDPSGVGPPPIAFLSSQFIHWFLDSGGAAGQRGREGRSISAGVRRQQTVVPRPRRTRSCCCSLLRAASRSPCVQLLLASHVHADATDSVRVARQELQHHLRQLPTGLSSVLARTIGSGVAFHCSDLIVEERRAIEDAFRDGALSCLVATSTLAAGVNRTCSLLLLLPPLYQYEDAAAVPARRVIFRSCFVGASFLSVNQYQQMCGRAGRLGLDAFGESILICNDDARRSEQHVRELVHAKPPSIHSAFDAE